jgi:CheY-like chemotaxis protein
MTATLVVGGRAASWATSSSVHAPGGRSAVARRVAGWDARGVSTEPPSADRPIVRVVIVDADRRVRRDLAELLEIGVDGAVVTVAADPATAVDAVGRADPHVVVLDPRLPDAEAGLALISQLRSTTRARIVALGCDGSLATRALATGADECVVKNGHPGDLLDAVGRHTVASAAIPGPGGDRHG